MSRSAPTGSTHGSGNTSPTTSPSCPDSWPTGARSPWSRSSGTPTCVMSSPGSAPACTSSSTRCARAGCTTRSPSSAARRYLRGDPDWGGPAELTAAFAGCCEHVRESLSTLSIDNRWPMLDRLPTRDWVRGRVALLGDAAHPMLQYLAQGACQALEDSAVLAAELAGAGAGGPPVQRGTGPLRGRPRAAGRARAADRADVGGDLARGRGGQAHPRRAAADPGRGRSPARVLAVRRRRRRAHHDRRYDPRDRPAAAPTTISPRPT